MTDFPLISCNKYIRNRYAVHKIICKQIKTINKAIIITNCSYSSAKTYLFIAAFTLLKISIPKKIPTVQTTTHVLQSHITKAFLNS